jgi:hypothetical protein
LPSFPSASEENRVLWARRFVAAKLAKEVLPGRYHCTAQILSRAANLYAMTSKTLEKRSVIMGLILA